jgi:hypothetical protein
MEFEIGNAGRRTRALPGCAEVLDSFAFIVKNVHGSIRVIPRPFKPSPHVSVEDWNSTRVSALGFVPFQRDESLLPIDLVEFEGRSDIPWAQ